MKKNLSLLSGIVLSLAILASGGCNQTTMDVGAMDDDRDPQQVRIYFKVAKRNGKKRLKMHNLYNPNHRVVDTLETIVIPGDTVVWEPSVFLSRIQVVGEISPKDDKGLIMIGNATPIAGTKNLMLVIPLDAPYDKREAYNIKFEDKKGRSWEIDPYLRIKKQQD